MERDDLYTQIHKVLRKALFDVCVMAGATDFADRGAFGDLRERWDFFDLSLRNHSEHELKFIQPALDAWAKRVETWAEGGAPADLAYVDAGNAAKKQKRDVFVYFIHEGKVRAPAAAMALIERLEG